MTHLNLFGAVAMQAAYSDGEEWLEALLVYLQGNLDMIVDYFAKNIPRIKVIKPEGTYLAWLDCRDLKLEHEELKQFMAQKARVGLSDGVFFGETGKGFLRLNFGCPRSMLVEALQRIASAVNTL
jgi:cystathionine beta-lyase